MSKILVTGATGHLGKAVTESLLKRTSAENITVLVRSAEKGEELKTKGVNVAIGDYENDASLSSALKDIEKVYLVSGTDLAHRGEQHENVINLAKAAGVKQVIYTSFERKNETETSPIAMIAAGHLHTEEALKNSGLTYTILLHSLYTDYIPVFAGAQVLETGTIYLPAENGKTAFVLRADLAEAAANILLDETGKYDNMTLPLTGPEALDWSKIATLISEASGKEIAFVSPAATEFAAKLVSYGVPEEVVAVTVGFSQSIAQNEFETSTNDLENILGRKPTAVNTYLNQVYGK